MIDQHHGISLLTQSKQRVHEPVVTYGDRYKEVAEESQITDIDTLVHYFADEQKEQKIKEEIIRGKCKILQQAISLGVKEGTYLRKFSLYSWGNKHGKCVHKLDRPRNLERHNELTIIPQMSYANAGRKRSLYKRV